MLKKILFLMSIATINHSLLAQMPTGISQVTQYTCVMHPEVIQDHPGKCPKCGMELVAVKDATKHRISHVEHPTAKAAPTTDRKHHHQHIADGDQARGAEV